MSDVRFASTGAHSTMTKLGYLGLIPFAFGLLLILTDLQPFELSGERVFTTYSVVILSFLAGIVWANGIQHIESPLSSKALILSNVIVLAAWFGLLMGAPQPLFILILILGYISLWRAEKQIGSATNSETPKGYFEMRAVLTLSVVIMHILVLLL